MKGNFFEQFKKYLLDEQKERLKEFIPYYETVFQAKEKLQKLLIDVERYYLEIDYEEDKTEGYTRGTFKFHLYENNPKEDYGWKSMIDYHYEMPLTYDERMWGYCECSHEDKGYDAIHSCCGDGCDWGAPEISLIKIENLAHHSFQGVERDLWKLEEEWEQGKVDHEEKIRKAHLNRIEKEIKYLEEQKQQYLK